MTLESRIALIIEKTQKWLQSPDTSLQYSAKKTYEEGYFHKSDVIYAIQCLMEKVTTEQLMSWSKRVVLDSDNLRPQNILCLHAGNLPLVGFQDALAVLLSGHNYYGKISRKDPYLLPDFLSQFKDTPLESRIRWENDLMNYKDLQADAVTFSGSESSIPGVMSVIRKNRIAKPQSRYLIRKAHFSIAYFDEFNDKNSKELVDAILRYDGKGCRSVAIVVSPLKLNPISCSFTDYFEAYWMHHATYQKPSPKIKYRYAYNKAVQKKQMLLEHMILEEANEPSLDSDNVISWIHGDIEKMKELADKFGDQLQNLYVPSRKFTIPGHEDKTTLLAEAQCPPIDWKPDGVDILKWLKDIRSDLMS